MSPPAREVAAYVAVGSNVEPRQHIPAALDILRRRVSISAVSTVYRSQAVGPDGRPRTDHPDFLNAVFELRADCGARELKFGILRPIEQALGRVRTADRYAPRTIDLDVVLYGEEVIDEPLLRVPAPDLARPFVAVPLLELAPNLVLPDTGEPLSCLGSAGAPAGMTPDGPCTRALKELYERWTPNASRS
ncbi:MAG TPA: 2-amino-4-hydroxy-6-hydroxymethyldihydropteridine diphosphokinase [Phycisphaerae bacterium]|nr:2-amino-4-hydroxy-6-hydroxymethyldihydropteridine diphosphokinase [Phycisphaerae bacterium]